jgi:hypothetical protein
MRATWSMRRKTSRCRCLSRSDVAVMRDLLVPHLPWQRYLRKVMEVAMNFSITSYRIVRKLTNRAYDIFASLSRLQLSCTT